MCTFSFSGTLWLPWPRAATLPRPLITSVSNHMACIIGRHKPPTHWWRSHRFEGHSTRHSPSLVTIGLEWRHGRSSAARITLRVALQVVVLWCRISKAATGHTLRMVRSALIGTTVRGPITPAVNLSLIVRRAPVPSPRLRLRLPGMSNGSTLRLSFKHGCI
jgi:hypothetical protein